MSYVGEPFEHDVFFSYARAESATEAKLLVDWSRHVIGALRDWLATALNSSGRSLKVFFDETGVPSGAELPSTFRTAAEGSACLVVVMSPYYPISGWCKEELETFFAKATQDGRGKGHCIAILAQALPNSAWPRRLTDERGGPIRFEDLVDKQTQLPLGLTDFEDRALNDAIRKAFVSIRGLLGEVRERLEARKALDAIQKPPVEPVIYLHARPDDYDAWRDARAMLSLKAIVNPDTLLPNDSSSEPTISQSVNREYEFSHGLALLRPEHADIRYEVMKAYLDRQRLLQEKHKNLPWAILDKSDDDLSVAKTYGVPRIMMSAPDWPDRLLSALGLTAQVIP
jgi:hypothetical protein